jgi:hypothetical protein
VADRRGWARDVVAALRAAGREADEPEICAVLAVVDVTSGFAGAVRLDRWGRFDFRRTLERRLGARGARLAERLLALPDPAGGGSFLDRFSAARDEAELDRAFRDLLAAWRARAPLAFGGAQAAARLAHGVRLEELHPIRTAGPMQVSVAWAAAASGTPRALAGELRSRLFDRAEGLRWGVARLFASAGAYREARYLFADYNASPFASRNAAFQEALAQLTGIELALDGDLMAYDPLGRPRGASESLAALERFAAGHGLGRERLRREVALEKSASFEQTATWQAVRAAFRRLNGADPPSQRVPAITLRNPKTGARSELASFVSLTGRRYRGCLAGAPVGVERRAPQ